MENPPSYKSILTTCSRVVKLDPFARDILRLQPIAWRCRPSLFIVLGERNECELPESIRKEMVLPWLVPPISMTKNCWFLPLGSRMAYTCSWTSTSSWIVTWLMVSAQGGFKLGDWEGGFTLFGCPLSYGLPCPLGIWWVLDSCDTCSGCWFLPWVKDVVCLGHSWHLWPHSWHL